MKTVFFLLISFAGMAQYTLADSTATWFYPNHADSLRLAQNAPENIPFLKAFQADFGAYYDNDAQYKRFKSLSIDALEMELYDLRRQQQRRLETAEISPFLKAHLQREADLQYWHLLFAYPIVRADEDPQSRRLVAVPQEVLRAFKQEDIRIVERLKYKSFRDLIPFYICYENSRLRNFEKYTNMLLMVNEKVNFALKHLPTPVADFAIAHFLHQYQEFLSVSLAQNTISQITDARIQERFTGDFMDRIVERQARKAEEAKRREEAAQPVLTFNDAKGKSFSLDKFKGKVVYIDFWASWCGPCKVQFPYAKKLHESMPDKLKKNVVFLYISIDQTVEQWKEGMKDNGLEGFINGHVPGGWNSEVMAQLGIRSIPRYLLVDKSGKVVNMNAPRPSQPELLSELIRLVE